MALRKISLGYNAVPAGAIKLIDEVFKSGQFSPGTKVKEFEEKFAALHKARHAVFVNSGTDALRLSLLALKEKYGWRDGDVVAVPALTFVATVNVILQSGLKPLFIDVSEGDWLMDRREMWKKVQTDNLRAIMPVHLFGKSCEMAGEKHPMAVMTLARQYGLKVVEDSCETILNPIRGDVSCHSTYMAHHLTTGVGGFALTNDGKLNDLIRSYANHGRNTDYIPGYRVGKDITKRFQFDRIGYSLRGTEFEAALGLSQLRGLKESVRKRRSVAEELNVALSEFRGEFVFPEFDLSDQHTFMMYPIVVRRDSRFRKYDICRHLEKCGIETRDMMSITNQPCYKSIVNEDEFPVAKWVNENGFYIPSTPNMTDKDIRQIKKAFSTYFLTK